MIFLSFIKTFESVKILILVAYENSEGLDVSVPLCSLVGAFTAHIHKERT